jgi:hypothetical protein
MKRQDLERLIGGRLGRFGFKRKGSTWVSSTNEVTKLVKVEQSNFSNSYYVTFGFVLKSAPLKGLKMHLYFRMGSPIPSVQLEIEQFLNLDSGVSDKKREDGLKTFFDQLVIPKLQSINTERDIEAEIRQRPNLNAVPGVIRDYFGMD